MNQVEDLTYSVVKIRKKVLYSVLDKQSRLKYIFL